MAGVNVRKLQDHGHTCCGDGGILGSEVVAAEQIADPVAITQEYEVEVITAQDHVTVPVADGVPFAGGGGDAFTISSFQYCGEKNNSITVLGGSLKVTCSSGVTGLPATIVPGDGAVSFAVATGGDWVTFTAGSDGTYGFYDLMVNLTDIFITADRDGDATVSHTGFTLPDGPVAGGPVQYSDVIDVRNAKSIFLTIINHEVEKPTLKAIIVTSYDGENFDSEANSQVVVAVDTGETQKSCAITPGMAYLKVGLIKAYENDTTASSIVTIRK